MLISSMKNCLLTISRLMNQILSFVGFEVLTAVDMNVPSSKI
jgi:hypothetical protein